MDIEEIRTRSDFVKQAKWTQSLTVMNERRSQAHKDREYLLGVLDGQTEVIAALQEKLKRLESRLRQAVSNAIVRKKVAKPSSKKRKSKKKASRTK